MTKSMILFALIAVAILVVVLIIILILLISKNKNSTQAVLKKESVKVQIDIAILSLPTKIEEMNPSEVANICRKIFETYKALNLKDKKDNELERKEWHSWQISMFLKLYKENREFFIPNPSEFLPKEVVKTKKESLQSLIDTILLKYKNNVAVKNSKDELSNDVIWTNKDISVVLYFLTTYKH